jgi:hypothetical protein
MVVDVVDVLVAVLLLLLLLGTLDGARKDALIWAVSRISSFSSIIS